MSNKRFEVKKYDAYISYHQAQIKQVEKVIKSFRNVNLKMWHDHDLFETDLEALQASNMFICFPSKEYKKCINNKIEYSIAKQREMKIISFNIDEQPQQPHQQQQQQTNENNNFISINFNRLNQKELGIFAKGIRKEIDQFSSRLLIRKKQDEMEKIFKNFKKTYEKTISSCSNR